MKNNKYDAVLFTHIEDGGLYWYRGVSKGTGDQCGTELHIYTDYYTGVTYHRPKDSWVEKMVPARARYLRFINKFVGDPWFMGKAFLTIGIFILLHHLVFEKMPEATDLLGMVAVGLIFNIILRIPTVVLYWKNFKRWWTA